MDSCHYVNLVKINKIVLINLCFHSCSIADPHLFYRKVINEQTVRRLKEDLRGQDWEAVYREEEGSI